MTWAGNLSDYPSSHRMKYSFAFSEQTFNHVIAEGEANIEPHSVPNGGAQSCAFWPVTLNALPFP
jgi:hypothetical protein